MPEAQSLVPGDPADLGPYKILGRLGEGGQGVVFLGRAPHSEHVAIKLLHARLSGDSAARARFVRELDVAKQVARFCTAQVLDANVVGDQPYIVSEYVDGRSLHRLVKAEGPRTGGALERLAIGTLTALTAIHQAGIVHRDFKPHNVMLGPDGPRVIDFGVARALGAAGDTQDIGTPSYMAPEQLSSAGLGPATDMFAWAATMVFAGTGRPPFGNDEVAAVMHRILHGEPDLGPLQSPLRDVVGACLAKDPAQRPTAQEAQQRLLGAGAAVPAAVSAPAAQPAGLPEITFSSAASSMGSVGVAADPAPAAEPEGRPPDGPRQTTLPEPSPSAKTPARWQAPLVIGVVVGALLLGVPLWAATRDNGDGGTGNQNAGAAPGTTAPATPGSTSSGSGSATPSGKARRGVAPGESPRPSAAGSASSGGAPVPQPPPRPSEPKPNKPNPYSATQVCNSGGHGGGYYVQRSSSFTGGRTYQLYNRSGYNCVVTLKTTNVGRKTTVWAQLRRQSDNRAVSDTGSFAYYAGPVFLSAKGTCVRYSGGTSSGSTSAGWANCG
jgi:serine/threonine protein kinase